MCPDLWDSAQHLDPTIRANLLQMANDFYEKTELPAPVIDIYLMGSAANYNWTPDSDIDVHVIIDYTKLQMPQETAFKTVKTAGAQWNAEHNILIKGHKVEMNIQNSAEQKPYVTGIYSLVNDQWLRKPFKMPFNLDRQVLKFQYETMKNYLNNTIRSRDREQMKAAKKYLDAYRQYGLDTYGELSYENIIYKMLRARGLIKQLKDSIIQVYDKQMTVDEVGERDIKQIHPTLSFGDDETFGSPKFDRSYWSKFKKKTFDVNLANLTMDELKALREKARRGMNANDEWADLHKSDFKLYNDELKRRFAYINAPVTEGVGAGIPETDRLKIKNTDGSTRRWQIRSKNAPKTPKMTDKIVKAIPEFDEPQEVNEDVEYTGNSIPDAGFIGSRKDFFAPPIEDEIPPEVRKIISTAEKVLDKKSINRPFFEIEYVEDLVGDIMALEIPHLPSHNEVKFINAVVQWLARDYDIRKNGRRIGE